MFDDATTSSNLQEISPPLQIHYRYGQVKISLTKIRIFFRNFKFNIVIQTT